MSNPISRHPMMRYAQDPVVLQGANVQLYVFHKFSPEHEGINIFVDYFERKMKGYISVGRPIETLELGVSFKDFVNEKISEKPDYFKVFPPREVYDPSIRMYFSIVGLSDKNTLEEEGNKYFDWLYTKTKYEKQFVSIEEGKEYERKWEEREKERKRRGGARKSRRNNKSRRRSASKKNHRKHRR